MRAVRTHLGGLVASVLALCACGNSHPSGDSPSGGSGSPALAGGAAGCEALVRKPLGEASDPTACVEAIRDAKCRDAVAKAIAERASRAQVVPAFLACRAAYCGGKVKDDYLCDSPPPSGPGEVRDHLDGLLDAAIASDQADTGGKLRGAGLLLEHAILQVTSIRIGLRTEPEVIVSGLGEDLRMGRPPTQESLQELEGRLRAKEPDATLADLLIDVPEKSASAPTMDIVRALSKAGFNHVVLCTSAGNCR